MAAKKEVKLNAKGIKLMITSGSVTDLGKTTISKNLKAYLGSDHTKHIGVETANKPLDGEDSRIDIDEDEVRKIAVELANPENNILLDVGGEHFGPLMNLLDSLGNRAQRRINAFICPVTPSIKPENVCAGIARVIEGGAPTEQIYIVFNKIKPSREKKLREDFARVFSYASDAGVNIIEKPIMHFEIVERCRGDGPTYDLAKRIDEDVLAGFANATPEEQERLSDLDLDIGAANMAWKSMTDVFDEILAKIGKQ